jgi:type I restriction enzyme R subunit
MIIDFLTEHGALDAARVYESPFTDLAPQGPDAMFTSADLDLLFDTVSRLTASAAPEA